MEPKVPQTGGGEAPTARDALNKSSGQAGAADRDGMQGANRSRSRCYDEDLQRGRPPEAATPAARALVQSIPRSEFFTRHRLIVLIPVYNHAQTLPDVVAAVRACSLDCLLVDDGSDAPCARVIDQLAAADGVTMTRLAKNGGKGAAVRAGLAHAHAMGYTHALQIDADGQHDLSAIARFVHASRAAPEALIGGKPVYGQDAPKSRLYGRWIMRVWVWINTLSTQIPDAMCGFRVYPLAACVDIIRTEFLGQRMEFDAEILVHLMWRGVPMQWLALNVRYPEHGVSHFRLWRDNLLISAMHARLFFGMLRRAPRLLWRRRVPPKAPAP